MDPVDFPIPVMLVNSFQFRASCDDKHEQFTLRITPAVPMGPGGQMGPGAQYHSDTVMTFDTLAGLIGSFASVMTPEQRIAARAALSDVQLPDSAKIVLPGQNGRGPA